ncbi:MAG: AI-2E family transporter [Xanthomonadales bacterium]|nr:AI-2E family transporter [Xanthomonadales bacterium]
MIDDRRVWSWLLIAAAIGGVLYFLAPVLTPFALSALFAYLGNPLVERLQSRRISRTTAVVIVFLLMTLAVALLLAIIIPALIDQARSVPGYIDSLHSWFDRVAAPWLQSEFGLDLGALDPGRLFASLRAHLDDIGRVLPKLLGGLTTSGAAVMGWVANLLLMPLITFYLMRDWKRMVERLRELVPRPLEPTVTRLVRESDAVLGSFLRGQMSVVLALAAMYATGLSLAGLKFGMLIGIVAGLVSFVPYLGPVVGIGGGLVSAIVSGGDIWINVGLVLAVFMVGQLIESFILTPKLVGESIGLHPVAVIFAVLAGGQLFGFFGVLLALPVAAVVLVLLRHTHEQYLDSEIYGAEAQPPAAAATSDAATSPAAAPAAAPAPLAPAPGTDPAP